MTIEHKALLAAAATYGDQGDKGYDLAIAVDCATKGRLFDISNSEIDIPSFCESYIPVFQNIVLIIFFGLAMTYL